MPIYIPTNQRSDAQSSVCINSLAYGFMVKNCIIRSRRLDSQLGHNCPKNISDVILPLLIQEGHLISYSKSMRTKYWLMA